VLSINKSFIYQNEWMTPGERREFLLCCGYNVLKRIAHGTSTFFERVACFSTWYRQFLFLRVEIHLHRIHIWSVSAIYIISRVHLYVYNNDITPFYEWVRIKLLTSVYHRQKITCHTEIQRQFSIVGKICLFVKKKGQYCVSWKHRNTIAFKIYIRSLCHWQKITCYVEPRR
jgi:hypothetical protein